MNEILSPTASMLLASDEVMYALLCELVDRVIRPGVHHIKTPVIEVTIRTCEALLSARCGHTVIEPVTDILVVEVPTELRGRKIFSRFLARLESEVGSGNLRFHQVVNHQLMSFLITRRYILDGDFFTRWS